jgi:PEP-utilising enzyme, mobile domain
MISSLIPGPLSLLLTGVLLLDWWHNRRRLILYAGPALIATIVAMRVGEQLAIDILAGSGLAGVTVLVFLRLPINWLHWRFQRSIWIRALGGRGCLDPSLVGRRAALLSELSLGGHPTVTGLVISTEALDEFLLRSGADEPLARLERLGAKSDAEARSRISADVTDLLRRGMMPGRLRRALLIAWRHLATELDHAPVVLVASLDPEPSAREECLAPHRTVGPVHSEREFLRAVRGAWCAHFTAEALRFRAGSDRASGGGGLALIAMPANPAFHSGVAVTSDPIVAGEMRIECHAVAEDPRHSGATPQSLRVPWRTDPLGALGPRGLKGAKALAPVLGSDEICQLMRLARSADHGLGGPSLLHWRPSVRGVVLTGAERLPLSEGTSIPPQGPWVRDHPVNLFTAPVSPLAWSHFGAVFNPPSPEGFDSTESQIHLLQGRWAVADLGRLRDLAASSQSLRGDTARPLTPHAMRVLRRSVRRMRSELERGHRRRLARLAREDLSCLPGEHLAEHVERLTRAGRRLHSPAMRLSPLRQVLLDHLLGCASHGQRKNSETAVQRLLALEEVELPHAHRELTRLADRLAVSSLSELSPEALAERFQVGDLPEPLMGELGQFLDRHGHLAESLDPRSPPWREVPLGLFRHLAALGSGGAMRGQDTEAMWRARWVAALGPGERVVVERTLPLLREIEVLHLKEAEALHRGAEELRRWLRAVVSSVGAVTEDDLTMLSVEEIASGLRHPSLQQRWPALISDRRAEWISHSHMPPALGVPISPQVQRGAENLGEGLRASPQPLEEDGSLIPAHVAAPGRVSGILHPLDTPSQSGAANPGEILLSGQARPEWARGFDDLQGLVYEGGSVLGLLAAACRERGHPMVIAPDARGWLQVGQAVEVDAPQGSPHGSVRALEGPGQF